MRAIKIDPVNKKITEIELHDDTIETMHKVLACECVCPVYLRNGHIVWVDDNGWIQYQAYGGFAHIEYPQPLAGFGLVLKCNARGENIPATMSLQEATKQFMFLPTDLAEKVREFYERRK